MKNQILALLLFAALSFSPISGPAHASLSYKSFSVSATEKKSDGRQKYLYWEKVPAEAMLEMASPGDTELEAYQAFVRKKIGNLDARGLLERQRSIYVKYGGADPEKNRTLILHDLILSGQVGNLRPVTKLEAFLMRLHLDLNKKLSARTEFAAYIMQKGDALKIFAGFGLATDGVAPTLRQFEKNILSAQKAGWILRQHIHNHPFNLTGEEDWGGSITPSPADLYSFHDMHKRLKLQELLVTNGFETKVVPAGDMKKYPQTLFEWPPRP